METQLKRKNRKFKRSNSYEGGTSKGRLEVQENPRIKKRVSKQDPSSIPKPNKDMVSKPTSQNCKEWEFT